MTTTRVAVFTGTRAEYGLLVPILRQLHQSDAIETSLIVAGAHLSVLHGMTVDRIVEDGFTIDARIEMLLASDTRTATTKSVGLALIDLASHLDRLDPDLLVVLGDRYELLAPVVAATIAGIPIAHIHGGEITEGAFDDSIRHAVTKLSHLHFVASEQFARRVEQMGEDPEHVHVVGAPAMDVIREMSPISLDELSDEVGAPLTTPLVVVAYHPSTVAGEDASTTIAEILAAVSELDGASVVCSLPNADPEFLSVTEQIEGFCRDHPRAVAVASLGHRAYLSLLRHATCLVGNSSSGLIEAPVLGTPFVNVGDRQAGRPMASSVISTDPQRAEILTAIRRAMSDEFRTGAANTTSPYDLGVSVAMAIVREIERTDLSRLTRKRFVDVPWSAS